MQVREIGLWSEVLSPAIISNINIAAHLACPALSSGRKANLPSSQVSLMHCYFR